MILTAGKHRIAGTATGADIMATAAQIEANRRNAQNSTGPKSPEGKEAIRGKSYKHGLTGRGVVVDEPRQAEIARRKSEWSREFSIGSPEEAWAFGQFVTLSVQLDRSGEAMSVQQAGHGSHAHSEQWDADCRFAAEQAAAKLAKEPGLAVRAPERTSEGIDLLLVRWSRLGEALDASGDWTEEDRSRALDLLAIPADLRRGRTPFDPPEGDDPVAFLRDRVVAAMDDLVRRRESLAKAEAFER